MLVMFTGIWKFAAKSISGLMSTDKKVAEDSKGDKEFVKQVLLNELTPERRLQLQEAMLICVDEKDCEKIIQISEMLAGQKFFPRKGDIQ